MHKALIQTRTEPIFRSIANTAWDGFGLLGYETEWFSREDFLAGKVNITKDTVVCGFISTYLDALEGLGLGRLKNIDYPDDLSKYLRREIWKTDLRTVFAELNRPKLFPVGFFVKPYSIQKGFTGFQTSDALKVTRTNMFPLDTELWVSEAVDFVSEYRFFILRGEVVGVGHYKGDPTKFPNGDEVRQAALDWKEAPAAWCIDFGVDSNGETVLVEVNDGHSMGDYGLYPTLYARLLEARWCELTGKDPIP
jgi:hypothetical protein